MVVKYTYPLKQDETHYNNDLTIFHTSCELKEVNKYAVMQHVENNAIKHTNY
jgi:hypothetical protein